jgi:hypothetical protein
MTPNEAYKILGLCPEAKLSEIKKQYRKLMMQVHPDSLTNNTSDYNYDAKEINLAYSVLKSERIDIVKKKSSKKPQAPIWNSPINDNAYCEREVLQNVEDFDGTVIGNFCIAKGKYLWSLEEDFSLFLLSMYHCSKKLLDDIFPTDNTAYQSELAYLLAQQFIAGTDLLRVLAKEEKIGEDEKSIFYIPSMLELSMSGISLAKGEKLYPAGIQKHRLYLKNKAGQKIGYLSFTDDRMYYVIIPLFEQRAVQVKIQVSEVNSKYKKLHLWLKLQDNAVNKMPENLNIQIDELIRKYRNFTTS